MLYLGIKLDEKKFYFNESKLFFTNKNIISVDKYWLMCERNFISSKNDDYTTVIYDVIETFKTNDGLNFNNSGKFIMFDIYLSMFDCLANDETNGFFDESDCPPPEFWIGFLNNKIISYIPEHFVSLADKGVEISMSGSLIWLEGLI